MQLLPTRFMYLYFYSSEHLYSRHLISFRLLYFHTSNMVLPVSSIFAPLLTLLISLESSFSSLERLLAMSFLSCSLYLNSMLLSLLVVSLACTVLAASIRPLAPPPAVRPFAFDL